MMDFYYRGILWTIPILFTLPRLTCNMVCPRGCFCIANDVRCDGPYITEVPKHLPVNTSLLILHQTSMRVIHEWSLANRSVLQRFSLTFSHLHTVHPRAFQVVPQLTSVGLSFNDLSTLPAQVFSPLTNLEQLFLNGNRLRVIDRDMFEGLVGLLQLDLSQNNLDNLAEDVFDGLTNLTFLNLGRNFIKKLPPTIFHSLVHLQELNIYNNELEMLEPGIFDRLVNLEALQLHNNLFASLPPQMFWMLRNLINLTLSSNRLTAIPEKSFYHMPKLKKLTIYKNPLLSLPDQLMGHMPEMEEFYLYDTNLTTVPGNLFTNMSGLLSLNFHYNEWLQELPSDLFCCLPWLHKLSLKHNKLVYLHPQLLSRLTTLSILLLNNNKLLSLPENIFKGLNGLSTMDLNSNNLTTLPGDIFLSNTNLSSLTLSDNPWDCTCGIRGIAKWVRNNEQVVLDRNNVRCHSPVHQQHRTLGSLLDEEFNFCDASSVRNYFTTQKVLHEPTKPFHTISTSGHTSTVASKTAPPTTIATTSTKDTQQVSIQTASPTSKLSVFHTTVLSTSLQTPTTGLPTKGSLPIPSHSSRSHSFSDKLVVQQGPEFVHHNRHKGWVYVWFLPSDFVLAGLLMFCHVFLVATGLFLILAAVYRMYRLNKTIYELQAEFAHTAE